VKDPAGDRANPASAGSHGVGWPPRGRTPRTPLPFRGAGLRAGSGGLAATAPSSRPVANRRSRGSPVVKLRRLADRAAVPGGPRGRGGGPLTAARVSTQGPQRSRLSGCHVIQRERPQPFPAMSRPAPAGSGPQRVTHGPDEGSHGGGHPFRWSEEGPTPTLAYPAPNVTARSCWLCPFGGSGAAAPQGALRAIDPSARPRSWRTFGPRRLRRQSQACPGCHRPWCRSVPAWPAWRWRVQRP
jgi:hypothetical protein